MSASTPEQADGNTDYGMWSWETILATVLNVQVADRSEVTGQPWLTIAQDGQPVPGAHLIWTANWNAKPDSGATTFSVYLDPALYLGGGPWDRFVNAPAQALYGPPGDLPLLPPTFHSVQAALASVTSGIQRVSGQLGVLHHNTTKEDTPLHGNAASVIGDLFSDLHGTTLSIYDQLSSPSYSDAVGAAGDAATTFLGDLGSAYGAWNQLAEHSPLGAIVAVLTSIATADGNGGYTIADPQSTPFGDLTAPGAWDAVEQQAKGVWLGPLDGSSAAFEGLDLLGRNALGKLVGQFAATTGTIAPVVGPAPPPAVQAPASGPSGPPSRVDNGGGPTADFVTTAGGGGPLPAPAGPGGPGGPGGGIMTPASGAGPGPGLPIPGGAGPILAARPGTDLAAGPVVNAVSASLNLPRTAGVLAGAIGATPAADGKPGRSPGADPETGTGFTGTVGRTPKDKAQVGDPRSRAGESDHHRHGGGPGHAVRTAPSAGFSVGGGGAGAVLPQSVVPAVAVRPPSVTSSPVNTQLRPASLDGGPLPAQPAAVTPPAALATPTGPGAQAGANGPMMMPPQAQGGQGQQAAERQRRAYLSEEDDYWGTEPLLLGPGVDVIDDDDPAEEGEFEGPRLNVGIGAQAAPVSSTQTMSEWRIG